MQKQEEKRTHEKNFGILRYSIHVFFWCLRVRVRVRWPLTRREREKERENLRLTRLRFVLLKPFSRFSSARAPTRAENARALQFQFGRHYGSFGKIHLFLAFFNVTIEKFGEISCTKCKYYDLQKQKNSKYRKIAKLI